MKKLYIIKAGITFKSTLTKLGDFDKWVIDTISNDNLDICVIDIQKGEKLTKDNIKRIRPGNGVHPRYYNSLINKKSPKNLFKGDPLTKNILSLLKIDIKK